VLGQEVQGFFGPLHGGVGFGCLFHWRGAGAGSLNLCSSLLGVPGFAPAGDLLSFASPKESRQRKGEPKPGPLRGSLRCARLAGPA
jgi:hypothetical protein